MMLMETVCMRKMRMRQKEWKRDIYKRLDNFLVPKCPVAWRARMGLAHALSIVPLQICCPNKLGVFMEDRN